MKSRKDVLEKEEYDVQYHRQEKYRGSGGTANVCFASKSGEEFVAIRGNQNLEALQSLQPKIPHMAKIAARFDDIFLFERARGSLLWENDEVLDVDLVERQLFEFANATASLGIAHADIRPWNVCYDPAAGVQVIDWGFALIPDTVRIGDHVFKHLMACQHEGRRISEIDVCDVKGTIRLIRGECCLDELWNKPKFSWHPRWCRISSEQKVNL